MLSRQSANSNRLETMAEELQSESGNCPASSGEHSSAKKISVEKVKKGSGKKRGRPKKHIGERSTGANVDMKDSCVGDEIPKIGDFRPSGEHWSAKKNNVEKVKKGSGKKRGRPKKHIGERSTGANVDMKDSCVGDEIPKIGDCHPSGKDLVVAPVSCRKQPRNGVKRHNGMLRKTEKTPMLEGQADATQYQVIPNPADSHEIDNAKYDYMIINGDSVLDDNQTLSMCYNARLPIGSDDSRTLPVDIQDDNGTPSDHGNTVRSSDLPNTDGPRDVPDLNQCAELNDEGEEVGRAAILSTDSMENEDGGDVGTAAFVSTDSMESEETIPFVKRSPLWESICSGKAYMKIKRKPHFQPLKEQEEVLREGSAIGLVVSFNNLVESATKLQPSSDISAIESILKTLDTFKPHGFDVDKVEEALAQLKLKKQKLEDLQKDYMEKESEILKIVEEGKLGDEEISQLRQKLSEAEMKKENREKISSALRSERAVDAENIQSLNAEYEKIVSSIL